MKRGALIVIEGVDRTGKSTQAKTLVENLKKKNIQAEYTNFPARDTEVGKIINNYLQLKNELSDEVIHLLFSANRWERAKNIIKTLEAGVTVIVDRYCYSGVAFSAAKGLDLNWCKHPDVGLPKPDKVFFLTMPLDSIKQRNGFGNERYEVLNFQRKVSEIYTKLKEDNWQVVDASRSIDTIQEEMLQQTLNVVDLASDKNIEKLWVQA
ncbi:thymidylate kinase [Spodoptera litura]|uniref:Thymidylate kinase n=1 Tax=Spodoptera litura TaxID=69820 RepID=A0A9J7EIT2_SPOLT|nr:thymidylate kinase [Spodoptera litura]XP_022831249.1 thymidylate kinase [Spodoptera litura]XP_022831250.1 thymidylate kinase [Spodoptera litura]XP_022831251.1 thymidylate kinase [Spodoptera litura]